MKTILLTTLIGLSLGMAGARAADEKEKKDKDSYPLTTCVVSGDKLDEMGEPYIFKHEGKEVRLCCEKCLKKFNADPEKYMKKIEDAKAKEKKPEEKEKEKK